MALDQRLGISAEKENGSRGRTRLTQPNFSTFSETTIATIPDSSGQLSTSPNQLAAPL